MPCTECGETVVHALGLCRKCLDHKRVADREARIAAGNVPAPVRPAYISIGLAVCSVCGVNAASLRGMCVYCYRKNLRRQKKKAKALTDSLK